MNYLPKSLCGGENPSTLFFFFFQSAFITEKALSSFDLNGGFGYIICTIRSLCPRCYCECFRKSWYSFRRKTQLNCSVEAVKLHWTQSQSLPGLLRFSLHVEPGRL